MNLFNENRYFLGLNIAVGGLVHDDIYIWMPRYASAWKLYTQVLQGHYALETYNTCLGLIDKCLGGEYKCLEGVIRVPVRGSIGAWEG